MSRCRSACSKSRESLRRQWSVLPANYWFILKIRKMFTCGIQLNFMTTWNTIFKIILTCGTTVGLWRHWHGENAYMWDLGKRLGTLYFRKKCLHVGPYWILWRLGTLCFKIMLTCGTDVCLWCFFKAYGVTKHHGIGNAQLQCQP
jgi:hypothetical protein